MLGNMFYECVTLVHRYFVVFVLHLKFQGGLVCVVCHYFCSKAAFTTSAGFISCTIQTADWIGQDKQGMT